MPATMRAYALFVIALFAPTRAISQCTKDTDCKGDRICMNGKCVEPARSTQNAPPERSRIATPSDELVRRAFSTAYSPIGMRIATIRSFQKLNGQASDVFGVKHYEADCIAEIEWIGQRLELGWNLRIGTITKERRSVHLEMTERGWKDNEGNVYSESPSQEQDAETAFLAEAEKQPGAVKKPSGLIYREIAAGKGATPKATDKVKVHYRGTLIDGTVFDSSVDRGTPIEFPLNGVIPCWTEGLQLMKVGGKSRLACPSAIAYGERGFPPKVKPGATLLFEVELLGIIQ